MYKFDFKDNSKHVHFVGIGGISMSTLAMLLIDRGFKVSGSDMTPSSLTEKLTSMGAVVFIPQSAGNVTPDIDLAVVTAAIHDDNPELMALKENNIPILSRAQFLGQVMQLYDYPCAIAGAHGKTTVTSMVSELFMAAGLDPTLSIGGILPSIGSNFRLGSSQYFVTEACEYTNSFLSFYPRYEIILNIDADHLDFFKDLDDIRSSFKRFASLLPENGALIINGDIDRLSYFTEGLSCPVITFGESDACQYTAGDITFDELARPSFTAYRDGVELGRFSLGVSGRHNVTNALSVIALASLLNINVETLKNSLAAFTGSKRRFELKGEKDGYKIIDDYAHHPAEIRATINAAGAYPHKKLWIVFQPHTYTRTKAFLEDFADALGLCDNVILAPIYPARETDDLGISSQTLARCMIQKGSSAHLPGDFEEIKKFIKKNLSPGDLLITMGAGDVVKIGEDLLSE